MGFTIASRCVSRQPATDDGGVPLRTGLVNALFSRKPGSDPELRLAARNAGESFRHPRWAAGLMPDVDMASGRC